MRTVRLGGVTRRGLTGGRGRTVMTAMMLACGVIVVWVLLVQTIASLVIGAVGLATVVALFTPLDLAGFGGSTLAGRGVRRWRWQHRVRTGLALFEPGQPARNARKPAKTTTGPRIVPDVLGDVRVVDVTVTTASTEGQVCVLLHRPKSGPRYVTVALEVDTAGGGVQAQQDSDDEYARWGRVKAALAREGSLVRGLQQVERVQPPSAVAHARWLNEVVPAGASRDIAGSYKDLLGRLSWSAETHRTLLVLRMPQSLAWDLRCREEFGAETDDTSAQLAVMEASRAASLMVSEGGVRRARPLSQAQLAAAMRACLTDAWSWTDYRDEQGQPLTLSTCWPRMDARDRRHVHVGDDRWIRTATVEGRRLPGEPVPVSVLRRLVTGIYPAVVRTMSVTEELVPAGRARSLARAELTQDIATATSGGAVQDGSQTDQLNASQVRLADLRPGSGHGGIRWAMHITVSGTSEKDLNRACDRLAGVCSDIGLPIRWLDEEHDLALTAVLPLGRGLTFTTRKVSR